MKRALRAKFVEFTVDLPRFSPFRVYLTRNWLTVTTPTSVYSGAVLTEGPCFRISTCVMALPAGLVPAINEGLGCSHYEPAKSDVGDRTCVGCGKSGSRHLS